MNKKNTKRTIAMGIICMLLVAAASWYSITFNNSRLVEPMELSEYAFQVQDLPMIISGVLLVLYVLYLFILLVRAISVYSRFPINFPCPKMSTEIKIIVKEILFAVVLALILFSL